MGWPYLHSIQSFYRALPISQLAWSYLAIGAEFYSIVSDTQCNSQPHIFAVPKHTQTTE